jgi:hypothetical protein
MVGLASGGVAELASTGDSLVATHLPFPSVCPLAAAGNVFRYRHPRHRPHRHRTVLDGIYVLRK